MTRYVNLNAYNGGIDADDPHEHRRHEQTLTLAQLDPPPTFVGIQEATGWHRDGWKRLHQLANVLDMVALHPVTSHVGDGENATALLYRPSAARLLSYTPGVAVEAFHHGLLRGTFDIDGRDVMVLVTHLNPFDGGARLAEAKRLTDYAGTFPGTPDRVVLLMDGNIPSDDDPEPDWETGAPAHLHARYRIVNEDGSFGSMDRRAMGALKAASWSDPQDHLAIQREATVGHWYPNEPTPLHLDHILTSGPITPRAYWTIDTPKARTLSDHLPCVLDTD
ncbi:endonuclease/exonuclease/phosphatase family protein [Streptomyces sp. NPDC096310]|uniref:endonuclease/exonuclease/phosphatase family protein n=1 Tax=Streptomyces sp. NPDC096310 TaxID=3366082 RepID=UPI0037F1D461